MAIVPVRVWAVDVSAWLDTKSSEEIAQLSDELLGPGSAASSKVKAYYRVPDKIRALAGQLLPRILYASEGVGVWGELTFSKTREGRPFLMHPTSTLDYNVTHDGDWIALASCSSAHGTKVGVDVMRVALPRYERSVRSFLDVMDMALTKSEREWIVSAGGADLQCPETSKNILSRQEQTRPRSPPKPADQEALARLFDLWTYKEAMTKNLGVGLGFDFARIEVAFWRATYQSRAPVRGAAEPRASRKATSTILTLSGTPESRYDFYEVELPPGRISNSTNRDAHTTCQLVVAHGPTQPVPEVQVRPALSTEEAKQSGLLTLWDMDQLVSEARSLRSK